MASPGHRRVWRDYLVALARICAERRLRERDILLINWHVGVSLRRERVVVVWLGTVSTSSRLWRRKLRLLNSNHVLTRLRKRILLSLLLLLNSLPIKFLVSLALHVAFFLVLVSSPLPSPFEHAQILVLVKVLWPRLAFAVSAAHYNFWSFQLIKAFYKL